MTPQTDPQVERAERPTTKHPGYRIWCGMINRCHNPNSHNFKHYGAKGITVCDEWRHSFPNFVGDMWPRPSLNHTLDRIDGSKGYSPGNCKWSTSKEQNRNKTSRVTLTLNGETKGISEWIEILGLEYYRGCIYGRKRRGLPDEDCVSFCECKAKGFHYNFCPYCGKRLHGDTRNGRTHLTTSNQFKLVDVDLKPTIELLEFLNNYPDYHAVKLGPKLLPEHVRNNIQSELTRLRTLTTQPEEKRGNND